MTEFAFFLRNIDELHVGAEGQSPALKDVVERIVQLAKMSATDLATLMGTEEGHEIAKLPIVELSGNVDPDSYLRSWSSIEPASPGELTETEYDAFLRGDNPRSTAEQTQRRIEIYGADLEREV
jgi:hypothetical protein